MVGGRWEASLQPDTDSDIQIAEEDRLRAHGYALLARMLAAPPGAETLARVRTLAGDDSEFGRALGTLAATARQATVQSARYEYDDLFVGVTRGELLPYASYYLTGFLHEKPLVTLRRDLARLGIRRTEEVKEPEDHIATLCEVMVGLIIGTFGAPADLAEQQLFFDTHLAPWAPRFFEDLERAKAAALYMPLGAVGRAFMAVEREAFAMAA